MKVERFINSIFKSNTYLLYLEKEKSVFVIDPGDSKPIIEWITKNKKELKGILITHSHFDHIYGVNELYDVYPNIEVYASKYAKEGMLSSKLNSSYYTDKPFVVICNYINIVEEPDRIQISETIFANVIYTPGHNNDCLSFEIEKNLFTGDAFIPGTKIYTKSKFGDKSQALNSIVRLFDQFDDDTMIWPGHNKNCLLGSLK